MQGCCYAQQHQLLFLPTSSITTVPSHLILYWALMFYLYISCCTKKVCFWNVPFLFMFRSETMFQEQQVIFWTSLAHAEKVTSLFYITIRGLCKNNSLPTLRQCMEQLHKQSTRYYSKPWVENRNIDPFVLFIYSMYSHVLRNTQLLSSLDYHQ